MNCMCCACIGSSRYQFAIVRRVQCMAQKVFLMIVGAIQFDLKTLPINIWFDVCVHNLESRFLSHWSGDCCMATVHKRFLRIWISKFTKCIRHSGECACIRHFKTIRQTNRTHTVTPAILCTHQFRSFANLIHFSQTVQRRAQVKCTPKLWWHSIHGASRMFSAGTMKMRDLSTHHILCAA